MALTRPRLGQLNTSVVAQADPITVLNQGASSANVDVGFLFNRANGLVSNVALYWSESAQSIVTSYTTSTGSTNSNISVASYANLTVGNVLLVTGSILNVQGNIAANTTGILYGNVNSSGNISTSGNVYASSFFYANGSPFVSSSYGNVQMLANLAAGSNPVAFGSNIITGNILPSANVTYDIGSPTLRFRTLYISGTTIDMGGAQITTDSTSGGFAFVPKPTTANPNPLGTVFSPTGGITTINTTGGIVAAGAINTSINSNQGTTNFGNVRVNSDTSSTSTTTGALVVTGGAGIAGNVFAGNVLATGFFYANGTPFVSSSYGNVQMLANLATGNNPVTFGSNLTVTNAVTAANVYTTGIYIGSGSATGGLRWSANGAVVNNGITYTAGTSPPGYPLLGDQWYNTSTDVLYEYINDGTSSYWVDVVSPVLASSETVISSAMAWTITSSNITVSKNNGYFVDTTTGPKTLTLPASNTIGDTVRINDLAGTFASNNLTVGANGGKIQGVAEDLLVSVNQKSFGLVYSNSTYGWKLLEL
jgi:hypothetical protein